MVIPAAFFYVLIMLVREAALIILVATAPISAGGLVTDVGKVWFWKTLRWFFSCLLISPMAALVLGIGVKLSEGVINPPAAGRPQGATDRATSQSARSGGQRREHRARRDGGRRLHRDRDRRGAAR